MSVEKKLETIKPLRYNNVKYKIKADTKKCLLLFYTFSSAGDFYCVTLILYVLSV